MTIDTKNYGKIGDTNWWVENNMGLSFHVNDDPNERYTFIVPIDDEK